MTELRKLLVSSHRDIFMNIFESKLSTLNSISDVIEVAEHFSSIYKERESGDFFADGGLYRLMLRLRQLYLRYREEPSNGSFEQIPKNVQIKKSLIDTLFEFRKMPEESANVFSWNKYRFLIQENTIIFITNSGIKYSINGDNYSYTTLYFALLKDTRLFIYLDTPWIENSHIFNINLEEIPPGILLVETVEGLMVMLNYERSEYLSMSSIYKVDFKSKRLIFIESVVSHYYQRYISLSETTKTFGSFIIHEDYIRYPERLFGGELERGKSSFTDYDGNSIKVGNIFSVTRFLECTGLVGYDYLLNKQKLGAIVNRNLEIVTIFKHIPKMFFDFFSIIFEENNLMIYDTVSGKPLKIYPLAKETEFSKQCAITRKDDNFGYIIWI